MVRLEHWAFECQVSVKLHLSSIVDYFKSCDHHKGFTEYNIAQLTIIIYYTNFSSTSTTSIIRFLRRISNNVIVCKCFFVFSITSWIKGKYNTVSSGINCDTTWMVVISGPWKSSPLKYSNLNYTVKPLLKDTLNKGCSI